MSNITSSRYIHVVACIKSSSFLELNNTPLDVHTTFCLSTHLSVDTCGIHILLANVNNAVVNVGAQVSVQTPALNLLKLSLNCWVKQ